MKGCKKIHGLIVEALYENLGPEAKPFFEEHLRSCPGCAAEFKSLGETLEIMNRRVRRDPGREFWDGYWDRLSRRLEMEKETAAKETPDHSGKRPGRFTGWKPHWAFRAAAAIALIIAGIFIGRTIFSPRPIPVEAARPADAAQAVRTAATDPVLRARSYVDRSKLVLLALVNYVPSAADPHDLDLSLEKQISRELVRQADGLKSDLKGPGRHRLRELVTDLETILLQISNLESQNDFEAVGFVKQGVESRGIFLKINLSEMGGDLFLSGPEPAPEKPPSQKIKT
jgi:Putative zinc-finger